MKHHRLISRPHGVSKASTNFQLLLEAIVNSYDYIMEILFRSKHF